MTQRHVHCELTASVLVAVVPAVVVPVTLPLGRDAGALTERTDRTCKVVPSARTLGAALNSCTHRKKGSELHSEYPAASITFLLGGSVY